MTAQTDSRGSQADLIAELRYHYQVTGFPPLLKAADALSALALDEAKLIQTSIESGLVLKDDGTYDYDSEKLDEVIAAAFTRASAIRDSA